MTCYFKNSKQYKDIQSKVGLSDFALSNFLDIYNQENNSEGVPELNPFLNWYYNYNINYDKENGNEITYLSLEGVPFNGDLITYNSEVGPINYIKDYKGELVLVKPLQHNLTENSTIKPGVEEVFNENPELANIGTKEQYSQYLSTIFPNSQVKEIVYHGTNLYFDKFDKNRIGSNTAVKGEKPAFSFSNNKEQAKSYSSEITVGQNTNELAEAWFLEHQHIFKNGDINTGIVDINNVFKHYKKELGDSKEMISPTDEIDPVTDKYKLVPVNDKNLKELSKIKTKEWQQEYTTLLTAGARVMSVILDIKSPKIVDFKGEKKSVKFKEEQLITKGDAFIAKNIDDWGKGDVIQVFEPEQIHILSSQADIQGFKEFVSNQTFRNSTNIDSNNDLTPNQREESLSKGLKWLSNIMPNIPLDYIKGLIDNAYDGRYDIARDLITLSEDFATKEVVKEEAFHRVFHLTSPQVRETLLNEGSKIFGIKRTSPTEDIRIEEALASMFRTSKDEVVKNTILGKFLQFIQNLFRNIFKEKTQFEKFFRDINQGRIKAYPQEAYALDGQTFRNSTFKDFFSDLGEAYKNFRNGEDPLAEKEEKEIKYKNRFNDPKDMFTHYGKQLISVLRKNMLQEDDVTLRNLTYKKINSIQKTIEEFKDIDSDVNFLVHILDKYTQDDLKFDVMLNEPVMKVDNFFYIQGLLNTYSEVIKYTFDNFLLSDVYKELDVESKESIQATHDEVLGLFTKRYEQLKSKSLQMVSEGLKKEGYEEILDENGELIPIKDSGFKTYLVTDDLFDRHPILAKLRDIIQKTTYKIEDLKKRYLQQNKDIFVKFKQEQKRRGISNDNLYDYMLDMDDSGKKTGHILRENNLDYYKGLEEARNSENKIDKLKFLLSRNNITYDAETFEKILTKTKENFLKNSTEENPEYRWSLKEKSLRASILNFFTEYEKVKNEIRNKPLSEIVIDSKLETAYSNLEKNFILKPFKDPVTHKFSYALNLDSYSEHKNTRYSELMSRNDNDIQKMYFIHFRDSLRRFYNDMKIAGKYLDYSYVPDRVLDGSLKDKVGDFAKSVFTSNVSVKNRDISIITNKEITEIPQFITQKFLDLNEKSFDLNAIIESMSEEAINYKYKTEIEPEVLLLENALNHAKTYDTNIKGEPVRNRSDKTIRFKDFKDSDLYKAVEYRIKAGLYEEVEKEYGEISEFLSKKDRAKITQIDAELSKISIEEDRKDLLLKSLTNREPFTPLNKEEEKYYELSKKRNTYLSARNRIFSISSLVKGSMKYTSFKLLAGNVFAGIGELLTGVYSLSLLSSGGRHVKEGSMLKFLGKNLSSLAKQDPKDNGLAKIFGSVTDQILSVERKKSNKVSNYLFGFYLAANYAINNTILLGFLDNKKIKDKNGVEHNLYETITVKDGKIELPPNFDQEYFYDAKGEPTDNFLNLTQEFRKVLREYRDRRNSDDPSILNENFISAALMQFKASWLLTQMNLRYGKNGFYQTFFKLATPEVKYDQYGTKQKRTLGAWTGSVLKAMAFTLKYSYLNRKLNKNINSRGLSEKQIQDLQMLNRELSWGVMTAVLIILFTLGREDDDDKKGLFTWLLNQGNRLLRDLTTYSSPNSLLSFFENPFPIISTWRDIFKFLGLTVDLLTPDIAVDKEDELSNYGDKFIKLIPVVNKVEHTYNKFMKMNTLF